MREKSGKGKNDQSILYEKNCKKESAIRGGKRGGLGRDWEEKLWLECK